MEDYNLNNSNNESSQQYQWSEQTLTAHVEPQKREDEKNSYGADNCAYTSNQPCGSADTDDDDQDENKGKGNGIRALFIVLAVLIAVVGLVILLLPPKYKLALVMYNTNKAKSFSADIRGTIDSYGYETSIYGEAQYNKKVGMVTDVTATADYYETTSGVYFTYDDEYMYMTAKDDDECISYKVKLDEFYLNENIEKALYNAIMDIAEEADREDCIDQKRLKKAIKELNKFGNIDEYATLEKSGNTYEMEIDLEKMVEFVSDTVLPAFSGDLEDDVERAMDYLKDEVKGMDMNMTFTVKGMRLSDVEINIEASAAEISIEMDFYDYNKTDLDIPRDVERSIEDAEKIDFEDLI